MDLQLYLDRIGYRGVPRADLETLRGLMRAHLHAVPFENIDVQLKRPLDLEPERMFKKIVSSRRGGWCYEMNGVLGWALSEIGFDVIRMAGGVMRESAGDVQIGNHLCLLVRLDRPYLADVGFGGSLAEPIPLRADRHSHPPFDISLGTLGDGYWRFTEDAGDGRFSFDFRPDVADETLLAAKCAFLQTDPASPFVQNLVAQKREGDRHLTLRGRVFKEISRDGPTKRLLSSPDELISVLKDCFGLDVPEAAALWPAVCERHEALFGGQR